MLSFGTLQYYAKKTGFQLILNCDSDKIDETVAENPGISMGLYTRAPFLLPIRAYAYTRGCI